MFLAILRAALVKAVFCATQTAGRRRDVARSWEGEPVTNEGDARRRPVAATVSSIALALAMAAYFPAMVLVTPAVFVCFVTPVVALLLVWATPRLSAATLYWSAATIAGSPLIWNLPGTVLVGMGALGVVLLVLLLWHYLWARGTSASV